MNSFHHIYTNFTRRVKATLFFLTLKICKYLAGKGFIIEHKVSGTSVVNQSGPFELSPVKGERFMFKTSGLLTQYSEIHEHWFTNRSGSKKFLILEDSHRSYAESRIQLELWEFLAHFSPEIHLWVRRTNNPVCNVQVMEPYRPVQMLDEDVVQEIKSKCYTCDFSRCRYMYTETFENLDINNPRELLLEVHNRPVSTLLEDISEKIPEINEILTGVPNDAQLCDKNGYPLADQMICSACGFPVFATDKPYYFRCIRHGIIPSFGYDPSAKRVPTQVYEQSFKKRIEEIKYYI